MKNIRLKSIFQISLVRSSLTYILSDAVNKAIPFLILPILAKYLQPASYGVISNYSVFITLLTIFISMGSQNFIPVIFYKEKKEVIANYIFNTLLIVFSFSILFILLFTIFNSYVDGLLSVGLNFLIIGVFVSAFNIVSIVNTSIWRMEEKPMQFGIYQISQTAVNVLLSLILIISFGFDWKGRAIGIAGTSILYGLFSLFILYRSNYINLKFDKISIKEVMLFGLPLLPHMISLWVRSGIDRVVVTRFYGNSANGIFVAGSQFGLIISFFILSFHNAFVPYLYKKMSVSDEVQLNKEKIKIVKFTYLYLLTVLLFCGIAVAGSVFFINHYLSSKYQEAVKFVPWAIFAQFFQCIYLMFGSYFFYTKKTRALSKITFSCSILHVALSISLTNIFGPIGASYASFIAIALNAGIIAIVSRKIYPMPWTIWTQLIGK